MIKVMDRSAMVWMALFAAAIGACSRAKSSHDAGPGQPDLIQAPAGSSLEKTALALSDQLSDAYRRRDWSALAELLAPDYLGTAPGIQVNATELKSEFPKIRFVSVRRDRSLVKLLGPEVLLVNEDAVLQEFYDGQDISGPYRFTTVWKKQGDRWRLLFEQEVPLCAAATESTGK